MLSPTPTAGSNTGCGSFFYNKHTTNTKPEMENNKYYGVFDSMYINATNKRNALLEILDGWVETQGDMQFDCNNNNLYAIRLNLDQPIDTKSKAGIIKTIILSYEDKSERKSTHALYLLGEHRSQRFHEDQLARPVFTKICCDLGLITKDAIEKVYMEISANTPLAF